MWRGTDGEDKDSLIILYSDLWFCVVTEKKMAFMKARSCFSARHAHNITGVSFSAEMLCKSEWEVPLVSFGG